MFNFPKEHIGMGTSGPFKIIEGKKLVCVDFKKGVLIMLLICHLKNL